MNFDIFLLPNEYIKGIFKNPQIIPVIGGQMPEISELEIIINSRIRKIIRNSKKKPEEFYNPYRDNYSTYKRVAKAVQGDSGLQKKYGAFLEDCVVNSRNRTVQYKGKLKEKDFPRE